MFSLNKLESRLVRDDSDGHYGQTRKDSKRWIYHNCNPWGELSEVWNRGYQCTNQISLTVKRNFKLHVPVKSVVVVNWMIKIGFGCLSRMLFVQERTKATPTPFETIATMYNAWILRNFHFERATITFTCVRLWSIAICANIEKCTFCKFHNIRAIYKSYVTFVGCRFVSLNQLLKIPLTSATMLTETSHIRVEKDLSMAAIVLVVKMVVWFLFRFSFKFQL